HQCRRPVALTVLHASDSNSPDLTTESSILALSDRPWVIDCTASHRITCTSVSFGTVTSFITQVNVSPLTVTVGLSCNSHPLARCHQCSSCRCRFVSLYYRTSIFQKVELLEASLARRKLC